MLIWSWIQTIQIFFMPQCGSLEERVGVLSRAEAIAPCTNQPMPVLHGTRYTTAFLQENLADWVLPLLNQITMFYTPLSKLKKKNVKVYIEVMTQGRVGNS